MNKKIWIPIAAMAILVLGVFASSAYYQNASGGSQASSNGSWDNSSIFNGVNSAFSGGTLRGTAPTPSGSVSSQAAGGGGGGGDSSGGGGGGDSSGGTLPGGGSSGGNSSGGSSSGGGSSGGSSGSGPGTPSVSGGGSLGGSSSGGSAAGAPGGTPSVVYSGPISGDTVPGGTTLDAGATLSSSNGQYKLEMLPNGDVVLVDTRTGKPVWSTKTNGHPGARLVMQKDGNLVVYSAKGKVLWHSGTFGSPGAVLRVLSNGELVIVGDVFEFQNNKLVIYARSTRLWDSKNGITVFGSSNAVKHTMRLTPYMIMADNELLLPGETIDTHNNEYHLSMQRDGNLVLYRDGVKGKRRTVAVWASKTNHHPGDHARMGRNGDLVIWSSFASNHKALWSSKTARHPGDYGHVQNDGVFNIYEKTKVIWTSHPAAKPKTGACSDSMSVNELIACVFGRLGSRAVTWAQCIAEHESTDNPRVFNSLGCCGLFQFCPNTMGSYGLNNSNCVDPLRNTEAALSLFEARGSEPWSTAPLCPTP